MLSAIHPELRLVAACCRPRGQSDRCTAIRAASSDVFDVGRLLAEARAHRVEAHVEDGLAAAGVTLPEPSALILADRARASRLQMLRNAGEEARLSRLLTEAGVDAIFVKGATLAMLAYRSLTLKTSWDIDLLVAHRQIDLAITVLHEAGYSFADPNMFGPDDQHQLAKRVRETSWTHAERGTTVELHWGLADNPALLAGIGMASVRQRVAITEAHQVSTLNVPDLFVYLALHGTAHGWSRLKWLADIAALAEGPADDLSALLDHAHRRNAGRCAAVALCLMRDILAVPIPIDVAERLTQDRHVAKLADYCARNMQETVISGGGPEHRLTRWWAYHRAHLMLAPGWRNGFAYIRAQLNEPSDSVRLRLPRWLLVPHALLVWLPAAFLRRLALKFHPASAGNAARTP